MSKVNPNGVYGKGMNGFSQTYLLAEPKQLAAASARAFTITGLVTGEISSYVRNLIWFPITFTSWNVNALFDTSEQYSFSIGTKWTSSTDLTAIVVDDGSIKMYRPYVSCVAGKRIVLGYVKPNAVVPTQGRGSWVKHEPYTTYELFLPYYGFVKLKSSDVVGSYIWVSICIDVTTGQATYYISAQDATGGQSPAFDPDDPMIAAVTFQLGISIPFGQSGMQDAVRNTLLTAVTAAATAVGVNTSTEQMPVVPQEEWDKMRQAYPNTGGLMSEQVPMTEVTTSTLEFNPRSGAAFAQALMSFGQNANVNHAQNAFADALQPSIPYLRTRTVNFTPLTPNWVTLHGYKSTHTGLMLNIRNSDSPNFVKVSSVQMTMSNMTPRERGKIIALLQKGVYY